MTILRHLLLAFKLGFRDGRENPNDLSSGLTWEDDQGMNEAYDHGVNVGQFVGRWEGKSNDDK